MEEIFFWSTNSVRKDWDPKKKKKIKAPHASEGDLT